MLSLSFLTKIKMVEYRIKTSCRVLATKFTPVRHFISGRKRQMRLSVETSHVIKRGVGPQLLAELSSVSHT